MRSRVHPAPSSHPLPFRVEPAQCSPRVPGGSQVLPCTRLFATIAGAGERPSSSDLKGRASGREAGSGTWSVSARGHPPDSFLGLRMEIPSLGRTRPLQVSLPPFLSPKLRGCAVGLGVQPGVGLAHWELSSQLHQDCCSERLRAPARALCFPVLPVPGPQCPSRLPPAGDSEAAFRWMQWSCV